MQPLVRLSGFHSPIEVVLLRGLRLLEVHPTVVKRTRTSRRARILKKHNRASALRGHLVLEVWVGHVHEGSWTVRRATAAKFAFEDVPHLCEVVSVERITRSGLVPNEAGVRLRRTICSGMKEKLRPVLKPAHLPF